MASTTYTDGQLPAVNAAWLNDVNNSIYDGNTAPSGTLRNSLADASTATKGAGMLGLSTLQTAINTVGWGLNSTAGGDSVLRWITPSLWPAILNHTSAVDVSTMLQTAINSSEHLYFPAGRFTFSNQLNINKSIRISGAGSTITPTNLGTQLAYTGTGVGLYLGATIYLTDVAQGYYRIDLSNFEIYGVGTQASHLIKNDGIRTLNLENLYVRGGAILCQTTACFAGLTIYRCRFITATEACLKMLSRNNNATILNSQFLAGGLSGISFEITDGFESQDITVMSCDFEGSGVGMRIAQNSENLTVQGCHFENNVQYSILIDNSNGTKNNLVFDGNMFLSTPNGGQGVILGNSTVSPIAGLVFRNNKFIKTPVTFYTADIFDRCIFEGTNIFSGTGAVLALPPVNWGPDPNAGFIPFAAEMPRYATTQAIPGSSADTKGTIGEIRWDATYAYIRTTSGWRRVALSSW